MKLFRSRWARSLALTLILGAGVLLAAGCRKKEEQPPAQKSASSSMQRMNMPASGKGKSMKGMSGMNMQGTKMSGSDKGKSMSGMNMSGMNMAGMKMQGKGKSMAGMNMQGMKMQGMNMAGMKMATPAAKPQVPNRVAVDLSQEQQQFIDIRTQPVAKGEATVTVRAVGIVAYDQARLSNINTRIMGWAEKLYVDKTGQFVESGARLMDLYSPALYSAEDEYLLAYQEAQRMQKVPPADAAETNNEVWKQSVVEAQDLLKSARKRLELWQIGPGAIAALQKSAHPVDTLPIRAPFSGYVIQKNIDAGQMVKPGMTLYVLADLSTIWINAQLYEYELPLVKVGQDVRVTALAHPGKVFHARLDFIYPYSDSKTRTTTARLVMKNPDGTFKPNDYVNAVIQVNEGQHLLVPSSAVYDTGVTQYVFVEQKPGHFAPRRITLGSYVNGDQVIVQKGLKEGEKIVTDGNFLLDSESQLRAASTSGGE